MSSLDLHPPRRGAVPGRGEAAAHRVARPDRVASTTRRPKARARSSAPHEWLQQAGHGRQGQPARPRPHPRRRRRARSPPGDDRHRVPEGAGRRSRFEYYKAPEKTDGAYRGDYFTLGDVGYVDDDGYLFLTDRSAHLIISGGVNIYPAEVEAVLLGHPAVGDVGVVGVPDDEWGEIVVAAVEPQPGVEPSPALGRRARRVVPRPHRALQVSPPRRVRRGAAPARQRQALQAPAARAAPRPEGTNRHGYLRRPRRHRHRLGTGHRPRARARVRRRGRQGRRQRPRRRHARRRRRRSARRWKSSRRSRRWAARPSPTARTSPTSPARAAWCSARSTRSAASTRSSTTPASCATACSPTWKSREWDAVIAVHLKGTFAPTRHAAAYWREQSKAGNPVAGRIVNTSSPSGVFGNAGQTNYGAAKAGIAVVHDHLRPRARPLRRAARTRSRRSRARA